MDITGEIRSEEEMTTDKGKKGVDQHCSYCEALSAKLISAFVFATWIIQYLYILNIKFSISMHVMLLCSSVYVRPVRKLYCVLSHDMVHVAYNLCIIGDIWSEVCTEFGT